jgi:hypothetical protein
LNAKDMAKSLRSALAGRNLDLTHSQALEIVAEQFGLADWNLLAARIAEAGPGRAGFPRPPSCCGSSTRRWRGNSIPASSAST